MRNLTILRNKSFVGCVMKDQVYIRDELTPELVIEGVPCRKMGDLKNGEQKTFQIEDSEQQIFLIADKVSKDYCNASLTIPEGQEDVTLSGKHKFSLGSNPFVFDGVELSPEQLARQKKNNRKGTAIFIGAAVVGCIIGLFLPGSFFGQDTASPKTFETGDFKITLTDAFEEVQQEGMYACYESQSVAVFAIREDVELFGDITIEEYGQLVLEANGRSGVEINQDKDLFWIEYTDTPQEQEIYYLAALYKGPDSYWVVNFATPASNQSTYRDTFMEWAASIDIGAVE